MSDSARHAGRKDTSVLLCIKLYPTLLSQSARRQIESSFSGPDINCVVVDIDSSAQLLAQLKADKTVGVVFGDLFSIRQLLGPVASEVASTEKLCFRFAAGKIEKIDL